MLWFGMVLAMGGFQMQMIARGILVYDMTGDAFITSIVGMGFAPSLLIVSLYGGVLGDRVERRLIIQLSQVANGILAGVVAFLIITGTIAWGHLLAVSVFQGAMFAVQMPARQAVIPSLVGKNQLANAFALNAMIESDQVGVMKDAPQAVPTPSHSGRGQTFMRCPTCQIALWSHYAGAGKKISFIRVGTLDNPDCAPPDIHIYIASKQHWVIIPEGVPAYEGYYDWKKEWPEDAQARRAAMRENSR